MTTLFLNVNMSIYRRMLKYILVFPKCTIIYRSSKEVSYYSTHKYGKIKKKSSCRIYVYVIIVKMKKKQTLCVHSFYRHEKITGRI